MPLMCLHCVDPACARSCPAQAIQIHETGAVLSALVDLCIGCQNCTIACPYGIPKMDEEENLMYKCDLCIDRTKDDIPPRSEEHTSELQSRGHLVCRLLLEKKKQ